MKKRRNGARIRPLLRDERGASAVEYGLILALIFLAVMGGITALGESVRGRWNDIANKASAI